MTRLLRFALAGALLTAGALPARAADDVTLILNWYLGGLHAPFYLGKERGFYADESGVIRYTTADAPPDSSSPPIGQ